MDISEAKERLLTAVRGGETIVMFGETVKASVSPEGEVYKVEVTGHHPKGFPHWNEETSVASWEGPEIDEAAKRVVDALAGIPATMMQEVTILAENVSLADLVWVTKPYDKLSDAPENIRELDGAKLTLAQVNWIANMADGLKGKKDIESPWAVAKGQFKKAFKKEGDKWVRPKEEKKKEVVDKEASMNQVQDAFHAKFNPPDAAVAEGPRVWTKDVFPTAVVAEDAGQLYRVAYTTEDDVIRFADRTDWEKGKMVWEAEKAPVQTPVALEKVPADEFWHGKEEPTARMFLAAAKAYLQRKESETTVWQEGDKRFYLGLVSLPSIKDKEGEVVTAEGADLSIAVSQKYSYHSGLYIKHVVPESLVGRSLYERRIGPFWVEFGEFKQTPLADWAFRVLEQDKDGKWRFSIGFITPKKQALAGRYTRLLKFDSTITEVPAQPLTAMLALMKKEDGGVSMDQSITKLMTFLNPGTPEEEAQVTKMLAEIFQVEEKELVTIAKRGAGEGKARAAIEALEDEALKKKLLAALDAADKPPAEPSKKEEGSTVVEAVKEAIAPLVAGVEGLTARVEAVEASAGSAALKELREALLTRSQDYVKPSESAPPVADGTELLKQLEQLLNPGSVGKHPMAGFAHGPSPAEGG